jgi:hypothetical protein
LDKTKFFNSKKIFSKPAWTPKEVAKWSLFCAVVILIGVVQ